MIFRERFGEVTYEIAISQSPRDAPPDASVTVPRTFFVMGDNRLNAVDSRYFGPVPFRHWPKTLKPPFRDTRRVGSRKR